MGERLANLRNRGPQKEVMILSLTDYRYETLRVVQETEHGLQCEPTDEGTVYRIIKHGPGFTQGNNTRWFAIMGQPFTNQVYQESEENVAIREFIIEAWGIEAWDTLTDEMKSKLTEGWGCTVSILPLDIIKDLEFVGDYHVLKEHLRNVFRDFAVAEEEPDKIREYLTYAVVFLLGAFSAYWFITSGIWSGV